MCARNHNIMEITKKHIYLILTTALALAGLIGFFVIFSLFSEIREISKNILSDKGREVFVERQNRELDNFQREYGKYESELKSLAGLFVNAENPVDFIKFLESLAAKENVGIDITLLPSEKSDRKSLKQTMQLQSVVKGDFANVMAFCESLERGPYFIQVRSLGMQKVDEDIKDPKAQVPPDAVVATVVFEVLAQ